LGAVSAAWWANIGMSQKSPENVQKLVQQLLCHPKTVFQLLHVFRDRLAYTAQRSLQGADFFGFVKDAAALREVNFDAPCFTSSVFLISTRLE